MILVMPLFFYSCKNEQNKTQGKKISKEKLNIPESGIHSLMEANSSKIIEGTQGSILLLVGEVTRKQADITIKRNDRILEEKLLKENEEIRFGYEERNYLLKIKNIKKPLIGTGKVELTVSEI